MCINMHVLICISMCVLMCINMCVLTVCASVCSYVHQYVCIMSISIHTYTLLLASYWCLVLLLHLGSVARSPLLVPPPGMHSPWKSTSCLKIMKVHFAGCLRLICIAVAGLRTPLSRFLEGAPYKFLNE